MRIGISGTVGTGKTSLAGARGCFRDSTGLYPAEPAFARPQKA